MSIASISGLTLWLDAETLELQNGANISQWRGISPTTVNAIGAGKPPTLAIVDDKKFVKFDKSIKQRMDLSANIASGNVPWTIFAVVIPNQTGHIMGFNSSSAGWDSGSDTYLKGFDYDGTNFRSHAKYNGAGVHLKTKLGYKNEIVVLSSQYQNQNSWLQTFSKDKSEFIEDKVNNITTYPYTKTTLGSGDGSNTNAYIHSLDGYIGELIAFDRVLSKEEINVVNDYLTTKWLLPTKMLIKSNDNYLTFKNSTWEVVATGTYPTTQQWVENGMDKLEFNNSTIEGLGDEIQVVVWVNDEELNAYLEVEGLKHPQIVNSMGDISLFGVEEISSITMTSSGNAKTAISFDGGTLWRVFRNGQWEIVDNAHNGMTMSEINSLNSEQIKLARGDSQFIRFSYSLSGNAQIDKIEVKTNMQGHDVIANYANHQLTYDSTIKTLIYSITKSGTYSVNYVS